MADEQKRKDLIEQGIEHGEISVFYEDDMHDRYDDMIRECSDHLGGAIVIGGLEYDEPTVIKEIDPTAYRCGFADWISNDDMEEYGDGWISSEEAQDYVDEHWDDAFCSECGDPIEDEIEFDGMCEECYDEAQEKEDEDDNS